MSTVDVGNLKPGDVVHVRMRMDKHGTWTIIDRLGQGTVIFRKAVFHVEPRPPEPLKVGDRVQNAQALTSAPDPQRR